MRDVVVVGGGQAGLAVGWYLRRTELDWTILDDRPAAGGAWRSTWDSLKLFSPARFSSLPGRIMPGGPDHYPHRDEVVDYLREYEERFELPVDRPVRVEAVRHRAGGGFVLDLSAPGVRATLESRAVIAATGRHEAPRHPPIPGLDRFPGAVLHSADYRSPEAHGLEGERVLVIGGGNSGAQLLAELSRVAETRWVTLKPPTFLPDEVDGRVLFEEATALHRAREEGRPPPPRRSLGDIVMVESVKEARDRGVLVAHPEVARFEGGEAVHADGSRWRADAVVLATGFDPALGPFEGLGLRDAAGDVPTEGTRSTRVPGVWLVGYGWTGFASATLIGVGRSARETAGEVELFLRDGD